MVTHKRLSLVSGNIEKGQALQKSLIELFKLANVTESGELEFSSVLNEMFMNPEVAQAYVGPLVDIYKAYERKVDAVIGYGAFGAVLASLVAREFQNLYKSQQHQVIALSFESIDVEKRQAKFAFGDCSKLLRNRRTGEAFFPSPEKGGIGPFGLLPNDMRVARRELALPGTTVPIDARWLADAELVIAAIKPLGTFEKALTLEGFVLPRMSSYR